MFMQWKFKKKKEPGLITATSSVHLSGVKAALGAGSLTASHPEMKL